MGVVVAGAYLLLLSRMHHCLQEKVSEGPQRYECGDAFGCGFCNITLETLLSR